MPEMQTNAFKRAIAQGKLQIGLWSSLCSNIAAEVISDSGFDWILLDTEHSPNEIPDLVTQLQAVQRGTATPIIRPAWNDAVMAKRALDIGAQTLLFPYVQNVEEAKRAVASTRYPPQGIRGVSVAARASRYGRVPDYLTKANDEICVLVQVETRAALDQRLLPQEKRLDQHHVREHHDHQADRGEEHRALTQRHLVDAGGNALPVLFHFVFGVSAPEERVKSTKAGAGRVTSRRVNSCVRNAGSARSRARWW